MSVSFHAPLNEDEIHESPLLKTVCRYPVDSEQMRCKTETASTVLSQYSALTTNYKYDAKGHRAESDIRICHEDYAYNGIGQRIYMLHTRKGVFNYTYDAQGKLTQVNDTRFQYDSLGRLAGITSPNVPTRRFAYERVQIGDLDIDRLSAFQDSTGKLYTYSYTPSNPLPIAVHSYGQPVVTYQWDESGTLPRLLSCTTSSVFFQKSAATWQFDYLPENTGSMPDSVILTGSVVAKLGYWDLNSLKCKLGYDHLGTVKLIADPFNALVKELFYDSFGNCMFETEQRIYFPLGFAGGLRDIASGFVCFGFRDYDPTVGRFTTPDPAMDLRGDGDIYDYCVDDPVNLVDGSGLAFSSAEAADAAMKGHKGISHPFGAKHGSVSIDDIRRYSSTTKHEEYKDKMPRTYVVGQRPLDAPDPLGKALGALFRENGFYENIYNLGLFHEGFVSVFSDESLGFSDGSKGYYIGPDKANLLHKYRYGDVVYDADIIDEAAQKIEKHFIDEHNKQLKKLKGTLRRHESVKIYKLIKQNCQDFVDAVVVEGKKIAKTKGKKLILWETGSGKSIPPYF